MELICLITDDFRFSYQIISKFKEERIPFTVLCKNDPVPFLTRIIVTTDTEAPEFNPDYLVLYPTGVHGMDSLVTRIKNYLKNIIQIESMVLGIDPGKKVGVVLLINDILVATHAWDVDIFPGTTERMLAPFETQEIVIRVGTGSRRFLPPILSALRKIAHRFAFKFELVDERETTKGRDVFSKLKLSAHELAALHIAMRLGQEIDIFSALPVARTFKKGELVTVQEQSRFVSEGMVTISRALARKVLEGYLSLQEALALQLRKNHIKDREKQLP